MGILNRNAVWRVLAAALAVSFVLSAWPGAAVGGESNEIPVTEAGTRQIATNTTIYVGNYVFDCMIGEPELPPELMAPEPASGEIVFYIIHFDGPINQEKLDAIRGLNITIGDDVPNNAYKVQMTPEQALEAKNLSFVDWVGFYHPAYKFSSRIDPGNLTSLDVAIIFSVGAGIPEDVLKQVRSGFKSIQDEGYSTGGMDYLIYGTLRSSDAIYDIAANPYVQYIDEIPVGAPFNEDEHSQNDIMYYSLVFVIILSICISLIFFNRKKQVKGGDLK